MTIEFIIGFAAGVIFMFVMGFILVAIVNILSERNKEECDELKKKLRESDSLVLQIKHTQKGIDDSFSNLRAKCAAMGRPYFAPQFEARPQIIPIQIPDGILSKIIEIENAKSNREDQVSHTKIPVVLHKKSSKRASASKKRAKKRVNSVKWPTSAKRTTKNTKKRSRGKG